MKYKIGEKFFSSKSAIAKYAQEILKEATPGQVLMGAQKDFILNLISKHPKAAEKIGVGVKHIICRVDPVWKKSKQFLIIRYDGTNVDFSYKKCVYGEISNLDLFRCACRTAVKEDIIEFKMANLLPDSVCPYFGTPLTKDNAHVDHVKPQTFNWLVDEFIKINDINVNDTRIVGQIQKCFEDSSISIKFKNLHRDLSILELVSDQANQTVCKVNWRE